jgi:hypothetical protein
MSFNRIKYDDNAYELKLEREVGPGDYRLFMGYNENSKSCFSYDGPRNSKTDVSIHESCGENQWGTLTSVESLLTNRVNKLSDANDYGKNDTYKNYPIANKVECDETLIAEDTRFTNPIEAFRCMDTTEYKYNPYLSTNQQCEIQQDRIGLNSRLRVKDTFVPVKPKIIDQNPILPRATSKDETINFCKNT